MRYVEHAPVLLLNRYILTSQTQYPLHILNLSSIQDLDAKIPKDNDLQRLDARRFRANIISK